MSQFTSNIMKVGAHLDDTRVMVEIWDPTASDEQNVCRIVDDNLLGFPSRSRAHDVMVRALRPRFISPAADIIEALKALNSRAEAFRDACYYELTRVDALVACFVEEQLTEWWEEGRLSIETADAREWIGKLAADGRVSDWSPNIRDRVARGMMAALRDFGRLSGTRSSSKKQISRPGISLEGFAYVAYRLHQQGSSSRSVLSSIVWRRWLLDERRVDDLMHRLASLGIVLYSVAGSSLRIDWRVDTLAEVARAAV
jgi:BrxA